MPSNDWSGDARIGLRLGDPSAPLRVLCYPHAGGGASAFAAWAARLPAQIDLMVLEPPGRWRRHREAPFRRVTDAADSFAPLVQELIEEKPTVLFGHSLGGLVMFEIAQRLSRRAPPNLVHLAVAARRPPDARPPERLWELDDDKLVQALGRTYGTARLAIFDDPEAREVFLAVLRADLEANGTYPPVRPDVPLDFPISAWGGVADAEAPREAMASWALFTRAPFHLETRPGGHFFVHEAAAGFTQRFFAHIASGATRDSLASSST